MKVHPLALALILVLSGCSALGQPAVPTTTPTETATATPSPTPTASPTAAPTPGHVDGFDATQADARRLQASMPDSINVGVARIGALSLMWRTNSTDARVPDISTNISELNRPRTELLVILREYLELHASGQINGSLAVTSVVNGERATLWAVEEGWVQSFHDGELSSSELLSKIRDSRFEFDRSTPTEDQ